MKKLLLAILLAASPAVHATSLIDMYPCPGGSGQVVGLLGSGPVYNNGTKKMIVVSGAAFNFSGGQAVRITRNGVTLAGCDTKYTSGSTTWYSTDNQFYLACVDQFPPAGNLTYQAVIYTPG